MLPRAVCPPGMQACTGRGAVLEAKDGAGRLVGGAGTKEHTKFGQVAMRKMWGNKGAEGLEMGARAGGRDGSGTPPHWPWVWCPRRGGDKRSRGLAPAKSGEPPRQRHSRSMDGALRHAGGPNEPLGTWRCVHAGFPSSAHHWNLACISTSSYSSAACSQLRSCCMPRSCRPLQAARGRGESRGGS